MSAQISSIRQKIQIEAAPLTNPVSAETAPTVSFAWRRKVAEVKRKVAEVNMSVTAPPSRCEAQFQLRVLLPCKQQALLPRRRLHWPPPILRRG